MRRPSFAAVAGTLAALALPAGRAGAQGPPPVTPPPRLAIAMNPLAIPFGVLTLDVESALRTPGLTLGVGGTWLTEGRDTAWGDARLMYFPNETAFRGFAIGITAGLVHEQGENVITCLPDGSCGGRPGETAPTLGVRIDYDWLVGARKRMLIGIGVGAKRTLKDVDGNTSVLDQVYGDGRFVIGIVF